MSLPALIILHSNKIINRLLRSKPQCDEVNKSKLRRSLIKTLSRHIYSLEICQIYFVLDLFRISLLNRLFLELERVDVCW